MDYDISNKIMTLRQRTIVARLEMLAEAAPNVTCISLYSSDYNELLKLKDKDTIATGICYKGYKLISART